MSPKNAIKIINIQKYYSVHIDPFFPLWFYSIHLGPIRSTLVLFGPIFPLSPIQSILVLFGPLWSYLLLISPHWSTLSNSINFGPIQSSLFLFGPILSIRYTLFHLCSLWSLQTTSIHFGPLRSIFVHFRTGKKHVQIENTYSKFKFIIYIYIYMYVCMYLKLVISKILSITFTIATLLLSHINIEFQSTSVRLNLSESLSKH